MLLVLTTSDACRVHFHTQLADKANKSNSEDVQQLLQAVYDIMAPEGDHSLEDWHEHAQISCPVLRILNAPASHSGNPPGKSHIADIRLSCAAFIQHAPVSRCSPPETATCTCRSTCQHAHDAMHSCVCAAFSFSVYAMFLVLLSFAAPLIKLIAHHFPDKGLQRVRQGRQVVIDIVKKLMADRRLDIENEQVISMPKKSGHLWSCSMHQVIALNRSCASNHQ